MSRIFTIRVLCSPSPRRWWCLMCVPGAAWASEPAFAIESFENTLSALNEKGELVPPHRRPLIRMR